MVRCRVYRAQWLFLASSVIFILDDGVGLFAKRIEIILNTTPQMLRISAENFGLMQLTAAD